MAHIFTMPELAESVVEGEITQWFIEEGATVRADEPLLEVMTDKVTVEIPSPYAGVLVRHLAKEGDVVPVGAPVAEFHDEGASEPATPPAGAEAAATTDEDDGSSLTLFTASAVRDEGELPQVRAPRDSDGMHHDRTAEPPSGPYGRPLAVPAARRLAREKGVDLTRVQGSGPAGRIRVADVEAAVTAGRTPSISVPQAGVPVAPELDGPGTTRQPMRGMRRAIARHMMHSHLSTVRALQVDEADVSNLVALRERLKERAASEGVSLSYLPFILTALARALANFPMLNARYDASDDSIVLHQHVHVGLAVATEQGLVVPVLRHVEQRSLLDLAREIKRKADAARDGTLTPEDVQGSTISVTNIGSIGGLFSLPVLNAPEAAILGVHAIKKRPVVMPDDSIAARHMLYLSLAFDHRLADGAEVAHFTNRLIDLLQEPEALLLDPQ